MIKNVVIGCLLVIVLILSSGKKKDPYPSRFILYNLDTQAWHVRGEGALQRVIGCRAESDEIVVVEDPQQIGNQIAINLATEMEEKF